MIGTNTPDNSWTTVYFVKDNYVHWYWNDTDLTTVRDSFLNSMAKDPKHLAKLQTAWAGKIAAFEKIMRRIDKAKLSALDDGQLARLYGEFYQAYLEQFMQFMALGDAVSMHADRYLVPEFKKALGNAFERDFPKLITTSHRSFVEEENAGRNKLLAMLRKTGKVPRNLLEPHARKFFYIQNNYAKGVRLGADDFLAMLKEDLKKPIPAAETPIKARIDAKNKLIKEHKLSSWQKTLLSIMDAFFGIQDTRKKYVLISNHYQFQFLEEASRRGGIPAKLLNYSIEPEFPEAIKGTLDKSLLDQRAAGCACVNTERGYQVLHGQESEALYALFKPAESSQAEIKGIVAAPGKVRGRVKIILKIHDMANMDRGDILVSSMTRPEMVPAMRLASAIVTDEGGLTCHAAIISRELKIPCIIGTKNATHTLKDGDLVEVDADQGLVRIIERAGEAGTKESRRWRGEPKTQGELQERKNPDQPVAVDLQKLKAYSWFVWLERPYSPFITTLLFPGVSPEYFSKVGLPGFGYDINLYQHPIIYQSETLNAANRDALESYLQKHPIVSLTQLLTLRHQKNVREMRTILASKELPLQKLAQARELLRTYWPFLWIIVPLEAHYKQKTETLASQAGISDVQKWVGDVSIPIKKNAYVLLQEALRTKDLRSAQKEFSWLKSRDGFTDFYTADELQEIKNGLTKTKPHKTSILPSLQPLARELQELTFFRADRTDKFYYLLGLARPIFQEVADSIGVAFKELASYDAESILAHAPIRVEAPFNYAYIGGQQHIQQQKFIEFVAGATGIVKGTCAYAGIARGIAKVVKHPSELGKVNEGDILISQMTLPSFISAMHKAAAFVTDEGGITCHAAIISRELKKPCIIGTKTATQALKDGDVVLLDADRGIVSIITKAAQAGSPAGPHPVPVQIPDEEYFIARDREVTLSPCCWNYFMHTSPKVKDIYGNSFSLVFTVYKDGRFYAAYRKAEWDGFGEAIAKRMLGQNAYFERLVRETDAARERIVQFLKRMRTQNLTTWTTSKLVAECQTVMDLFMDYDLASVFSWFIAGDPFKREVGKSLRVTPEELDVLSLPISKTNASQMEQDVLKAALSKGNPKHAAKELSEKYYWIPFNYDGPTVWDAKHFLNLIETNRKNPAQARSELANILEREKRFEILAKDIFKTNQFPKGKLRLIDMLHTITFWTDERKKLDYPLFINYSALLAEIGRRTGMSLKELKYLFTHELSRVEQDPGAMRALAQDRISREFLVIAEKGTSWEGTAAELASFKAIIAKQTHHDSLQGTVACAGPQKVYRAPVKVLRSSKDCPKIQKGEFLVATMTTPDYVQGMNKAIGFITDEGGVTCHAAIVAREMHKPCIISTKSATKLLQDGDVVEVDTSTGTVKIIERAAANGLEAKGMRTAAISTEAEADREFSTLAKLRWYTQGFPGCINFCSISGHAALAHVWNELGYGYSSILISYKDDYVDASYCVDDLEQVGEEFLARSAKDKRYLQQVLAKDRVHVARQHAISKKVRETNLAELSPLQAAALHQEAAFAYTRLLAASHSIEGTAYVIESRLKRILEQKTGLDRHSKEIQKIIASLIIPEKPSFIYEELESFNALVRAVRNDRALCERFAKEDVQRIMETLPKQLRERIQSHAGTFFYNRLNYYNGDSMQALDYVREIQGTIRESKKQSAASPKPGALKDAQAARDALIAQYGLDHDVTDMVQLASALLQWQDERKKNILIGIHAMNATLRAVARAYSLPFEELKRFSPDELTPDALAHFDHAASRERFPAGINPIIREQDSWSFRLYIGAAYERAQKHLKSATSQDTELHGAPASPGKVTGQVFICKTPLQIASFPEGAVLVTSMTRPEYIPAMRKAVAIVTDEGGITCHAAIVSRELGKPCVIGTKYASTMLKNGQVVEVNANHGVVRIIEELGAQDQGMHARSQMDSLSQIGAISHIDWVKFLDRRRACFIYHPYIEAEYDHLIKVTGFRYAHHLYKWEGDRGTHYRSAGELQRSLEHFLALVKENQHKKKSNRLVEFRDLCLKWDRRALELEKLFTTSAKERITLADFKNYYDEFIQILLYTVTVPYLCMCGIDYALEKGESKESFKPALALLEPLRGFTSYPKLERTMLAHFFALISKQSGIADLDLVDKLTPQEIEAYAHGSKLPPVSELESRRAWCAFWPDPPTRAIMFDYDRTLMQKLPVLQDQQPELKANEIRGTIAYPGTVRGRVCRVDKAKDMAKCKAGDILVSINTSPDLLPALKLCSAIVSDEGGVMCHAAIVSREMKKPCVIGTKIATKALHDGDMVEVDCSAGAGVVRILERAGAAPPSTGTSGLPLIDGKQWIISVTRNLSLLDHWLANEGSYRHSGEFGVNAKSLQMFITIDGLHSTVFVNPENNSQYIDAVFDSLKTDADLEWLKAAFARVAKGTMAALQACLKKPKRSTWDAFMLAHAKLSGCLFLTAGLGRWGTERFMKLLKENGYSEASCPEILSVVTYPPTHTPLFESQLRLVELAAKAQAGKLTEKQVGEALAAWVSSYGHIPVNFYDEPWTLADAKRQYAEALAMDCSTELRRLHQAHKEKVKAAAELMKSFKDPRLAHYAKILQACTFLNEFRKNSISRISLAKRPLFERLRILGGLSSWRDCLLLLPHELADLLEGKLPDAVRLVSFRKHAVGLVTHSDGTHALLSQADAAALEAAVKQRSGEQSAGEANVIIKGMSANRGVVQGRAKIVISSKDFDKVAQGDILVAPMTSVDYVPIMKRAAAFITNEGGITSHASIVAREMDKPCVIGTKNATQLLSDGDLVEVNGHTGMVRIIARAGTPAGTPIRTLRTPIQSTAANPLLEHAIAHIQEANWYRQGGSLVPFFILCPYFSIVYELGYDNLMTVQDKEENYGYFNKDAERVKADSYLDAYLKDSQFIKKRISLALGKVKAQQAILRKVLTLKPGDDKGFAKLIPEYNRIAMDAWTHDIVIEMFDPWGDTILRERLAGTGLSQEDIGILTSPMRPALAQQELIDRLAIVKRKDLKAIPAHQSKYYWIKSSWQRCTILPPDYFKDLILQDIKKPAELMAQVAEIKKHYADLASERARILKARKLPATALRILAFFEELNYWRDLRRVEHTCKINHDLTILLERLAQHNNVRWEEIQHLTTMELKSWTLAPALRDEVSRRLREPYGLIVDSQKTPVHLYGEDARKLKQALEQKMLGGKRELSGMSAYPGKVTGIARIVNSFSDMQKLEPGEIIISIMTRPELLPALKKAAAIVTDEGGITCHAAIVSRELKKPCIVGTQLATHFIKDGDMIEVDANKGIVRVLKEPLGKEKPADDPMARVQAALAREQDIQQVPAGILTLVATAQSTEIMLKELGFSYPDFTFVYEYGHCDMCYFKDTNHKIWTQVQAKLAKDKKYLVNESVRYKKDWAIAWKQFQAELATYQKNPSPEKFCTLFSRSMDLQRRSVGLAHFIESVSMTQTHKLKDMLALRIKDPRELARAMNILTMPLEPSFLSRYHHELAKAYAKPHAARQAAIQKVLDEYYYVNNSYAGRKRTTVADVLKNPPSAHDTTLPDTAKLRAQKAEIIKRNAIPAQAQELATMFMFLTTLQDERKAFILQAVDATEALLDEAARQSGISREMLSLMTPEDVEASKYLEPGFAAELAKRSEYAFVLYSRDEAPHFRVLSGRQWRERIEPLRARTTAGGASSVSGTCASTGKAVGKVHICRSLSDIAKFPEGYVLVASMTRPEFMPALKKAVAIVTDEGGITCHAAIVSRELCIPCVIGTKIGTRALKNGDLVEVNANHGIVKIIERRDGTDPDALRGDAR